MCPQTHTITQLKDVIKQKYMEMVVYQLKKENIGKATEQISDNLGKVQQQVTEADEVRGEGWWGGEMG